MTEALLRPYLDKPLCDGWNPFLQNDAETGMEFAIYRLKDGQSHIFGTDIHETALLTLEGKGVICVRGVEACFERTSWREELPWAAHAPRGEKIVVHAHTRTEMAVVRTINSEVFTPHVYFPDEIDVDHRAKDMLDGTSYRIVRTIFDRRNAPAEASLVLGEVVTFPGRWSSYPPHHHPQPELYYYRFSPEWGYGHGELGETVFKLRQHDLLRITESRDHAQSAPPGIYMYYLWTIRHLPGNPYTGFEYTSPFESLLR